MQKCKGEGSEQVWKLFSFKRIKKYDNYKPHPAIMITLSQPNNCGNTFIKSSYFTDWKHYENECNLVNSKKNEDSLKLVRGLT